MAWEEKGSAVAEPAPDKIAQLRRALEEFEAGEGRGALFDPTAEEAKAPVRARALRLLDQRARSRHELRQRLIDAECDPELVDEVLEDLARVGLMDDAFFAHEWVRQRHHMRGKSAAALDRELQEKGVSAADRAAALEQVTEDSEESIMWSLARKKARSIKEPPADRAERDKALRRIVGVLQRRGFPLGASLRISKEALDERLAELGEDYSAGLRISL
ncbi:recombination regulator RecX [Corynebacterium lizhenjunii]|uniref:recombination regulator RecX n=1 Tax=Corynebacterium lizhenjunii TaxID=2709394 RepID=UPI003CC82A1B